MTEQEWQACADHQRMLAFLHGKASDRKLRLFSVVCCDRYRHVLTDERCRTAVRVGERFADGLATAGELFDAEEAVWQADQLGELRNDGLGPACAYCCYREEDGSYSSGYAAEVANHILVALGNEITSDASYEAECKSLSNLLRCIFGPLPFRAVPLDPAWLTSTVTSFAHAVYSDRAFDRLPILADALEDAGCTQQDILGHCRQPGEHCRGCWVVDLLLGKEGEAEQRRLEVERLNAPVPVTVIRTSTATGDMYEVEVAINGQRVGAVYGGQNLELRLRPGRYTMEVGGGGLSKSLTFTVEPGESLEFEMYFSDWGILGGGLVLRPADKR